MKDIRHHLHCYNAEQASVVFEEHGLEADDISAVYGVLEDHFISDGDNQDVVLVIFFKDGHVMTTDAAWLTKNTHGIQVYATVEELGAEITIHKAVQVW